MFAEQRQQKIMHMLEEYQQVDVSSLTSVLSASEATIRRDLEKLERAGLLCRTHGGAILAENNSPVLQVIAQKDYPRDSEVESIGKTASRVIEPGEVIAIGSGLLGLALARNLGNDSHCTIVTNDAMIMTELLGYGQTGVIMVGGLVHKNDDAVFTSGEPAIRMLEEFSVSKAFLSVDGVNTEAGLTIQNFEYALIWKKLMEIASETVIMAMPGAFGKRGLVRLVPAKAVQRYVTTGSVNEEFKRYCYDHNIPIHLGFDL